MPTPTSTKPFLLMCKQCGWKKVWMGQSDAVIHPKLCPRCGKALQEINGIWHLLKSIVPK